jgi:hypothetical protein
LLSTRAHWNEQLLKDTVPTPKDTAEVPEIRHRKYEIEAGYASNNTYKGRRDSVDHLLLSPSFSYIGIYGFNAGLSFSHSGNLSTPPKTKAGVTPKQGKQPVFDQTDLSLGWDHDWTKKFSTSILETHSFFDAKSARLRSTIDNDFTIGATYNFKYVVADVSGDWAHGKKTAKYGEPKDYFYTGNLSHDFDFDELGKNGNSELEVEPKISCVYGTQNFIKVYTKGKALDSTQIKHLEYEKKLAKYNILNYELALPVTYTFKQWMVTAEWDYNIPQNVVGGSSTPYSVFAATLKYTIKGKGVVIPKKKKKQG